MSNDIYLEYSRKTKLIQKLKGLNSYEIDIKEDNELIKSNIVLQSDSKYKKNIESDDKQDEVDDDLYNYYYDTFDVKLTNIEQ